MESERMHAEYLQMLQELRRMQMMRRRSSENCEREFGFLRMIHEFHLLYPEIPGIYVSELAEKTGLTKSGVCKMLNSLEQKELIRRTVDPNNRRNTFVALAPKGMTFCECQRERWSRLMEQVAAEFGEERFLETMGNIREIMRIMERHRTNQEQQTKEETQCERYCNT